MSETKLEPLTLIRALCILNSGWKTPVEERLYEESSKLVIAEAARLKIDAEIAVLQFKRQELS